jgi:hypothetical protein
VIVLVLSAFCLFFQPAQALNFSVVNGLKAPREMKAGEIYFAPREPIPFAQWNNPLEKTYLNLFPTFRMEPSSSPTHLENVDDDVVIFIAYASFLVDRPADTVKLESFVNLDTARDMQQGLATVELIQPSEVVTGSSILNYRNPAGARWCEKSHSICVKTQYILDTRAKLAAGRSAKEGQKPEIASQSEVAFVPTVDQKQFGDLKKLTGIDTTPTGMIVLSTFWFQHALEFGKVVVIVQADPADKRKTIFSTFSVFAIEHKHWNIVTKKIIMGEIGYPINGKEGLSQGLPKITAQVIQSFAQLVSR